MRRAPHVVREIHYVHVPYRAHKSYSCMGFLWDLFLVTITGGLWLIWIFVREMRRR